MGSIEKMLQQYILGAVQVASQNHKSKYPVALVKIDTDSTLADFNRELDKSKVFLEHEVSQILLQFVSFAKILNF